MTLLAIGSVKGAPGVTTTALGLTAAWPRPAMFVEADPCGGSVAAALEVPLEPGLVSLAAGARNGLTDEALRESARPLLSDTARVLVGPASAVEARGALAILASELARWCVAVTDFDVIVDVGRVTSDSPSLPFVQAAVSTLLCVRPVLPQVQHLPSRVAEVASTGASLQLLCIGSGQYSPQEIAEFTGVAPAPGEAVPSDSVAAESLGQGRLHERALRRSRWWRSIQALADTLADQAAPESIGAQP